MVLETAAFLKIMYQFQNAFQLLHIIYVNHSINIKFSMSVCFQSSKSRLVLNALVEGVDLFFSFLSETQKAEEASSRTKNKRKNPGL